MKLLSEVPTRRINDGRGRQIASGDHLGYFCNEQLCIVPRFAEVNPPIKRDRKTRHLYRQYINHSPRFNIHKWSLCRDGSTLNCMNHLWCGHDVNHSSGMTGYV